MRSVPVPPYSPLPGAVRRLLCIILCEATADECVPGTQSRQKAPSTSIGRKYAKRVCCGAALPRGAASIILRLEETS